jgi:hypothetical protein
MSIRRIVAGSLPRAADAWTGCASATAPPVEEAQTARSRHVVASFIITMLFLDEQQVERLALSRPA